MIALLVGGAGVLAVVLFVNMVLLPMTGMRHYIVSAVAFPLMPLPGIVTYGLLTRRFGPLAPDGECHCRKCNYILRGISEPRCPECGEPI
mgnify:CR=1 FL=1